MRLLYAARAHAITLSLGCFDDSASDGSPSTLMDDIKFLPIPDTRIFFKPAFYDESFIRSLGGSRKRFLINHRRTPWSAGPQYRIAPINAIDPANAAMHTRSPRRRARRDMSVLFKAPTDCSDPYSMGT